MDWDFYSLGCYAGCSVILFFLLYKYEHETIRWKKFFSLTLSYLVIVSFCSLRFYVGNDYANYVDGFYSIKQFYGTNIYFWEPAYFLLNLLFMNVYAGYIYVFCIASLLSFYFIFKTLLYRNILNWGIFFAFTLGLVIFTNDVIRQGVALSIFMYSIRFIEEKNFWKYFTYILLATTFHFSAIILIFIYFVRYIKFQTHIWLLLLLLVFLLQYTGILRQIFVSALSYIPYYNVYMDKVDTYTIDVKPGIGIVYRFLMACMVAFAYRKSPSNIILNIYLLGSVLYVCSIGLSLLERIAFYMMYTNIIVFANFMTFRRYRQISRLFAFLSFLYFAIQSLTGMEKHGAVPYRTIINEDLENPPSEYYQKDE